MKRIGFIIICLAIFIPSFSQKRLSTPKSREAILNEKYCSGIFDTPNGEYIDMLENNNDISSRGYLNILEWMRGRIAGFQVYTTRNGVSIPYLRNQQATVFVDEMRVSYDYLLSLPTVDIAMIKVLKGPFYGGWGGAGGAIAIYTFIGDEEDEGDQ